MNEKIKELVQKVPGVTSAYNAYKKARGRYEKVRKTVPKKELQFEVHLTEYCNLNCKGCDNFSPLAPKEFTDIKIFEKDLNRLSKLFNKKSGRILLLGGEPLLHPDINPFFAITRAAFPDSPIFLYTNGILLRKMADSFWEACASNDVVIYITRYPIDIKYDLIAAKAVEFDVKLEAEDKRELLWKCVIDLEGNQDPNTSFIKCHKSNKCMVLKNGKLYTCTLLPTIEHFNRQFNTNLHVSDKDGIDIYGTDSSKEIMQFLAKPVQFCRYCNIDQFRMDLPFETSKKDISEWT